MASLRSGLCIAIREDALSQTNNSATADDHKPRSLSRTATAVDNICAYVEVKTFEEDEQVFGLFKLDYDFSRAALGGLLTQLVLLYTHTDFKI